MEIGGNRWNQVAEEFAAISIRNKWPPRDEESIKSKFKNLKNVRKPTGDPNCLAEVKRAKRIQVEIDKAEAVLNLGETYEEDEFDDDENEEDDEEEVEEAKQEEEEGGGGGVVEEEGGKNAATAVDDGVAATAVWRH